MHSLLLVQLGSIQTASLDGAIVQSVIQSHMRHIKERAKQEHHSKHTLNMSKKNIT